MLSKKEREELRSSTTSSKELPFLRLFRDFFKNFLELAIFSACLFDVNIILESFPCSESLPKIAVVSFLYFSP